MKNLFIIIILSVSIVFFSGCDPDFSKYEYLKEPQISTKPKQKMIVVELKGDPSVTGGEGFSALFKAYYKLKSEFEGMENSIPVARWPKPFDTPRNEWIGIYGLPVPENVDKLSEKSDESDPDIKLTYWDYGEVAEILHVGAYSEEAPTVDKLHKFVKDKGYKIIGIHEEEYLKGPGMFFKGNPKKYLTIIRYGVEKI